MSIPPRFLDEIRARLILSEVIGRRIPVKRAGRECKACCPFHHEKTPSFTINDDKQFYHCFGCGAHGDVVNFVMQHDNLSFMDTVEMLAAEAGLQVPKQSAREIEKSRKEKDLYALLEDATQFFQRNLYELRNRDALEYLRERGLSEETIASFRIGFAPDDGQILRKYLLSKEYNEKDMIAVGVLKTSDRGGEPYAFFRDRVMFPVPDRRGRVVAFGGRILPEHLRPPQRRDFTPPKYINSTETELFHKGGMFYGEPHARRAAADGQGLVVVEGYLDVIACVQAGIKGTLAPMGTALTEEQILSLWKMIPSDVKVPILCFDGDNAGRKAAVRVCERILPLLEPGRSVNFAFMPDGQDPDSLVRSGGVSALNRVLKASISLFDFIWESHVSGRDIKTPEIRAGVIKKLENEVACIANKDIQIHYKSLLRQKVSEHFFPRRDVGRTRLHKPSMMRVFSPANQQKKIFPRALLAAILNHPHIFADIEEVFGDVVIQESALERMRQVLVGIIADNSAVSRGDLLQTLKNLGFSQEMDDILSESVYVHASFCSPNANEGDVRGGFLAFIGHENTEKLKREIKDGISRAYQSLNQEDIEKVKVVQWVEKTEGIG